MPQRVFRTAAGVEWHVWSVIPGNALGEERRHGYDRRSPDPVIRYKGDERRQQGERREGRRQSGRRGLLPVHLFLPRRRQGDSETVSLPRRDLVVIGKT